MRYYNGCARDFKLAFGNLLKLRDLLIGSFFNKK